MVNFSDINRSGVVDLPESARKMMQDFDDAMQGSQGAKAHH
jgi:hypothetical protein